MPICALVHLHRPDTKPSIYRGGKDPRCAERRWYELNALLNGKVSTQSLDCLFNINSPVATNSVRVGPGGICGPTAGRGITPTALGLHGWQWGSPEHGTRGNGSPSPQGCPPTSSHT